jgi:hypothetical protein
MADMISSPRGHTLAILAKKEAFTLARDSVDPLFASRREADP